jgi:hypothetical protein
LWGITKMHLSDTADDLWRRTLSQISTVFGRLEYLASLRNIHTGRYEHFGLEQRFSPEISDETLRRHHETAFGDWVSFSLESQRRELLSYLTGREEPVEAILRAWLRVKPFPTWVPANTRPAERALFLGDLDVSLELIRRERGVAAPDPDA